MEVVQKMKSEFVEEISECTLKKPSGVYLITKRIFDITFSVLLFPFMLPLMVLIAILIKLDSKGPVFYNHTRVGKDEIPFLCFKFRTMVVDAHQLKEELKHLNEMQGPAFKMKEDPRTTKLGKLLRRLSLDELPQIFNILFGSMSFVGPRPPLPEEVLKYNLWQKRRLSVKPGLTCLWQVSGRNNIDDFDTWVSMDLKYIERASLMYDLVLILKTVPVVLFRKGAY